MSGGERTVTVDGMRSFAAIPELEALGGRYAEYVVRARRLGGTLLAGRRRGSVANLMA